MLCSVTYETNGPSPTPFCRLASEYKNGWASGVPPSPPIQPILLDDLLSTHSPTLDQLIIHQDDVLLELRY